MNEKTRSVATEVPVPATPTLPVNAVNVAAGGDRLRRILTRGEAADLLRVTERTLFTLTHVSGGQVRATLAARLGKWPLFVNGGQRA